LGQRNILNADTQAVFNTVNTKGIKGKGIALQFKKAYLDMFRESLQRRKSSHRKDVYLGKR
jgi:hypothetical protein